MGMDSKRLSRRRKQPGHDRSFEMSERNFVIALRQILPSEHYEVTAKPRDLADLFPREGGRAFGVVPEASVTSRRTGRMLFFEVKKQGEAGNADERACKHHTVQFYRTLRDRFGYKYHPFFTIMCESLAASPRYTLKHPYFFEPGQYFLWVGYDMESLRGFIVDLCRRHLDGKA